MLYRCCCPHLIIYLFKYIYLFICFRFTTVHCTHSVVRCTWCSPYKTASPNIFPVENKNKTFNWHVITGKCLPSPLPSPILRMYILKTAGVPIFHVHAESKASPNDPNVSAALFLKNKYNSQSLTQTLPALYIILCIIIYTLWQVIIHDELKLFLLKCAIKCKHRAHSLLVLKWCQMFRAPRL